MSSWLMYSDNFQVFLNDFYGLLNLGSGNYSGSIGETSTILIVLIGIYLAYEKVIDWIIPTLYIATILIHNYHYSLGLWLAFNLRFNAYFGWWCDVWSCLYADRSRNFSSNSDQKTYLVSCYF